MIVYADSSALVKLFVHEVNSEATRDLLRQAQALGTGLLARAELGAAMARGAQRGLITLQEAAEARRRLAAVWPTWIQIGVDEDLVARAEALAWKHHLRGYVAVHLVSALIWQERIGHPVMLATFDRQLWEAARDTGLTAWPEPPESAQAAHPAHA
jgi:predicted nucleic acid-binding protein